jgi:hypothetical protein
MLTPVAPKVDDIHPKSNRAVVTMAVGPVGRILLGRHGASVEEYAQRIGADFYVLGGEASQPNFPQEDKFRLSQYLAKYDRVIYLDADITVTPSAPDLFSVVPSDYLGICDERLYDLEDSLFTQRDNDVLDMQRAYRFRKTTSNRYYNTGLMVASREHARLFEPMTQPYRLYHTAEQDLINARIIEYGTKTLRFGPELVWMWFANQDGSQKSKAKFHHFAGFYRAAGPHAIYKQTRKDQRAHLGLIDWIIGATGARRYLELGVGDGDCLMNQATCHPGVQIIGVDRNLPPISPPANVRLIQSETVVYLATLDPDELFDVVFIDADHDADAVLRDLNMALAHVHDHGLIVMHDTFPAGPEWIVPERCGTAYRAARKLAGRTDIESVTIPFHPGVTIIRKRSRHLPWEADP